MIQLLIKTGSLCLMFIIFGHHINAQVSKTSFETLDSLNKSNPKNTLVFIHTNWCKYCLKMKRVTFENLDVKSHLNNTVYFIELDAESRDEIHFKGKKFKFKASGNNTGVHELATQLATINGKVSYPSLCLLNEKYEIIYQYSGYLNSHDLLNLLEQVE